MKSGKLEGDWHTMKGKHQEKTLGDREGLVSLGKGENSDLRDMHGKSKQLSGGTCFAGSWMLSWAEEFLICQGTVQGCGAVERLMAAGTQDLEIVE